MKRRDFIKTTSIGAVAGLGGIRIASQEANASEPVSIKKYGTLGRTGLKISDISFGGGALNSPTLMAKAVEMGVNYFDTAPDYGPSEKTIGKYLKKSGGRDKVHIATKFCDKEFYPGHLDADAPESRYIEVVEESLGRMNTDYVDLVFVHAMGEESREYESRLLSENMLNAFAKLKKAGKARFLAVSSHGPVRMEELMMKAVKSGHYDVIMPAHNFMKFPKAPDVIEEAGKRNIGVVAMKTLAGAKEMKLDTKGDDFAHAAFKWVLQNPNIAGLVVTIKNFQSLSHYVKASGKTFTKESQYTLDQYKTAYSTEYCRTGCGDCLGACPEGLNIAGVLRQQMYFTDYHEEKKAMTGYARMSPNADVCASCSSAPCESACGYNLPVKALLTRAKESLTFRV